MSVRVLIYRYQMVFNMNRITIYIGDIKVLNVVCVTELRENLFADLYKT